jgi:hypothetical protein
MVEGGEEKGRAGLSETSKRSATIATIGDSMAGGRVVGEEVRWGCGRGRDLEWREVGRRW